jgi:hypothetical protein
MTKTKKVGGDVPTNGAQEIIALGLPYQVVVKIQGVSDLLFHRWNCESIEEKAKAKKGSAAKKTDDLESYVYRNEKGELCIPGEYLRMAIINAAKYKQDPRSPRKSAMDLYKAGIVCLNILSSLGTKAWDYEDKRRVVVQRAGINRVRPAMKAGWEVQFDIMINTPEYIAPMDLNESLQTAGRLIGLGDFRPTYGRFVITKFEVKNEHFKMCA